MGDQALKILYTASTDRHLRSFHIPCLTALAERGHMVTAAADGSGERLPKGVRFMSVPFTKRMFSLRNLRCAALLAGEIRREGFDLIVTHTSLAAFFTRLGVALAGKGRTRVVNTVHGYLFDDDTPFLRRTLLLWAEKLMAPLTDDILVMNRYDRELALRQRLCRGRVEQIGGMGLDTGRFPPAAARDRQAARAALKLPEGAFVLLCAAEFSARKNQRFLIEAMARLPEDTILLLPGEGALRGKCQALAEKRELMDRIRFPGQTAEVLPYLHAADICVSASRSEGLPFHVMEAMSCALPSVLSRVKGHEDLVTEGETGLLYPFGDDAAFLRAVETLYRDAALRQKMGRAAAEKVRRYDISRVLPELLSRITGK